MTTISQDIFYKINELMNQDINLFKLDNYPKTEIVKSYITALLSYTNAKLYEVTNNLEINDDFAAMLEKFAPYFKEKHDREFFYQQFGHSMLNLIGTLEDSQVVWFSNDEENPDYPLFVENEYGTDFITSHKQSNKDISVWLYDYLQKKYLKQSSLIKK